MTTITILSAQGANTDGRVIAAVIAFVGALIALIVRDLFFQLYLRRDDQKQARQAEREKTVSQRNIATLHYAAPLQLAASSLYYRLAEIVEGPASYLLVDAPAIRFLGYKRISTLYRLAAVLGWIYAYRTERAALDPQSDLGKDEFEACVNKFQMTLADGHHIEERRVRELARIWSVSDQIEKSTSVSIAKIAKEIDSESQRSLAKAGHDRINDLDPGQIEELCHACAVVFNNHLQTGIERKTVEAKIAPAKAYLGIVEAYIYRDWQFAIGEMMTASIDGMGRRFNVMGFREFEERFLAALSDPTSTDASWIERLDRLFKGVDMKSKKVFDVRPDLIRQLFESSGELKQSLDQIVMELRPAPLAA